MHSEPFALASRVMAADEGRRGFRGCPKSEVTALLMFVQRFLLYDCGFDMTPESGRRVLNGEQLTGSLSNHIEIG